MANLVTYAKTAWQDLKTAITAARLNNMEQGISDCATQINKLGDSVSRIQIETGSVVVQVTQSNVKVRTQIRFKKAFSSVPSVSVSAQTSYPEQCGISVDEVTTSGFVIVFLRSSSTSTGITWIAAAV